MYLSRMRSEGFSLGVETCSLDAAFASATVRNRPQPFATVRNRTRATEVGATWPCLWQVLQNVVTFGGFKRRVAWFRVAGSNMFHNMSKVILCDRRNTFAPFSPTR